jgi:hypothetical protein
MDINSISSNYSEMMNIRGSGARSMSEGVSSDPSSKGVKRGHRPPPPPEMQKLRNSLSEDEQIEMDDFMKSLFDKIKSGNGNEDEILNNIPESVSKVADKLGIDLEKEISNIVNRAKPQGGNSSNLPGMYGAQQNLNQSSLLDIVA